MKEAKKRKIEAKCTQSEYEQVITLAAENNMSVAEFVRNKVLSESEQKNNSFEIKVLKTVSAIAAYCRVKVDALPDDKFEEFKANLDDIKEKNGINE